MAASDSSLSIATDILRKLKTLGLCLDLDEEEEENRKKPTSSFFNRIVSAFIEQTQTHHVHQRKRPIPPLLGNGEAVDLLSLYHAVMVNGGYESVTANRLWDSVAESVGCPSGAGSSVKLIFSKYFDELCRCLGTDGSSLDVSSLDVSELKPLSALEASNSNIDGDVVVLDPVEADQDFTLLKRKTKRKREPLIGMLDWLLLVARNPCDHSIGMITCNGGKDREFEVGLMFSQAHMARRAMFHQPKKGSDKIHPLINGDSNGVCKEKLEHGESIESLKSPCQSCAHSDIIGVVSEDGEERNHAKKRQRRLNSSEYLLLASLPVPSRTDWVRVGTSYQAEVPDWAPVTTVDSDHAHDPKWIGTKIWPPEKRENRSLIERDPICKGRNENCGCQSPGSIECVRFHVREKRNRLKLEIGSVFYHWGFDHMGEEVALSWTEEEEHKFKAVVRLNRRCVRKNLWNHLFLTFPNKGRKTVLSYYFNVFLLRERSYQNRATPENIDSD